MTPDYGRRHWRIGWWSLLCFLVLGVALEAMHGLKAGFYLDASNETRRLMWTLAHAHGTLVAIVHLAFAGFVSAHRDFPASSLRLASWSLACAGILLPLGFFLGGVVVYAGDPSVGIILVPVGAALLAFAVLVTARAAGSVRSRQ